MSVLPEIDSRFDVLAKLGEGGMGCVYKVRHRDLDEVQIVKTLQAHLSTNEALKNRFVNEARRGMRLRHPHIAGVHDFQICADGTGYIVMEYVHGHNLRDLLATRGPLPLKMVGAIAVQTLDALGYLHGEKFVHRDISPDNLMLETTGGRPFVKLIDLGISKSLESGQTVTGAGQFLGKLQYASPEQFGGQIDGRSDLYSLGVTLYRLLTNADPFVGDNYQLIKAHLFQPPRPFEEAAPDVHIPEAVQKVIYRALEKDPNKRYADAMGFCAAVEEAFDIHDARPVRATRPARTETDRTPFVPIDKTVVSLTTPTEVATFVPGATTVVERRPRRLLLPAALLAIAVLAVAAFVVWRQMQAATVARYGTFRAVVIGESEYRRHPSLPTAVDDARAVGQLLHDKYGFEVTTLENKSGKDIIAAIKAANADNLLIFYAGHGELKNDKGYWLPVDADLEMTNWISPTMIRDVLLDQPARRTLIIADSCYSGALARGALTPPGKSDRADKRSRMVISSGGMFPVVDSADGHHSIFTRALLDVLGDPGAKVTDVQSVFAAVHDRVVDAARRAGREQKPELAVIAEVGDEGGTFVLVRR
jgi:tRNA A-37 threonylcarbamoyl transferase component Bud32